jgi:hypothetical protein
VCGETILKIVVAMLLKNPLVGLKSSACRDRGLEIISKVKALSFSIKNKKEKGE